MSDASEARLSVRADASATRLVSDFVGAFALEHGIDGDDRARILIVVEELITNIVKYAYPAVVTPGSAEIALRLEGGRLGIEIVDDGRAFDPFAQAEPDLEATLEARPIGRLGLLLVKTLMDRCDYRRVAERNVTTVGRCVTVRSRQA